MGPQGDAGDDVYLAKALEEAVGADERTAELGVTVEVRGGRAFLRGTVASERRKTAVGKVAAERARGHEIVNEIQVIDPGNPDGDDAANTPEETLR